MDYAWRMRGLLRKHRDRLVSSQGIITGMIKTYRDVSVDSAMLMSLTLSSWSSYM